MINFYNQTVKDVLKNFNVDPEKGLSDKEVLKRREKYGPNSLNMNETPLWKKILEPFIDIFMAILMVALVLSLIQGDWIEAIAIGVIIIADAAIYYIQRFSTDRILRSLKNQTVQGVSVLRNGEEQQVASADLVPGDIVILHEGDRIPADGRIIAESGLLTEEAVLTGESEAVAKDAKAISGAKKIYEQRNMVFSGAFIFTGTGRYVVTATGNDTEYGRIASLATSNEQSSPITDKINKLVIIIAAVVLGLAVIALIVQLIDGIALLDALKFTLAMIVSAVPEGLSIAISIVLALCAKRMAKKQALIRELKSIESLGVVTTIASDKTGTLTENRLGLKETWQLEKNKKALLDTIAHAVLLDTTLVDTKHDATAADPLDTALLNYLREEKYDLAALTPIKVYAFDQSLKLSGNLYRDENDDLMLTVKGAPEVIMNRSVLTRVQRDKIEATLVELAGKGYKVIAVANGKLTHEINELTRLDKDVKLHFAGLIAVADSLRKEAPTAIRQAARMGVKTKMVTGDHAGTAFAIGRELGLASDIDQVLDCSKLGNISDDDLADAVRNITVFARVTPEDKNRILAAIKRTEICAMTGDGVNDVPALTGAHVGIAMGDSPSIVQDAGDIVLLDNNFKNITEAIKESRTVLANIRRMLGYLLATNAGEAITMIGALILFGGQMLTPIQILWINLATDSLLVIPLGLEPPEQKVLRQKPEKMNAPILSGNMIGRMILLAVTMAVTSIAVYAIALNIYSDHAVANTLAFTSLVVMQWSGAITARGNYESAWERLKVPHKWFHIAMLGAVLLQVIALFGPLAVFVDTVPVPLFTLALVALVSFVLPLLVVENYKKFRSKS